MKTESLYDTLEYIIETDTKFKIQSSLKSVATALLTLVQTPAQPPVQQALADAMTGLDKASEFLKKELTPSRFEQISEIGGGEFFNTALASEVRNSVAVNAMTPSVASTYVQDKLTRRSDFLENVNHTLSACKSWVFRV